MASESFFILALIHFNLASTIDHQGVPALCSITSHTIFAGRGREGECQRQNQGLRSLSKTWDRPSRPGRLEREPESVDHSDRPPTTCQRDRQRQRSAAQAGGGRLSDWSSCCGEAEKGGKPSSGEIGRLACTKTNFSGGPVCSSPDCSPPLPGSLIRPALPSQPCAPPRQDRRALPLPLERWRRWLD